jgi:hypothetical protein
MLTEAMKLAIRAGEADRLEEENAALRAKLAVSDRIRRNAGKVIDSYHRGWLRYRAALERLTRNGTPASISIAARALEHGNLPPTPTQERLAEVERACRETRTIARMLLHHCRAGTMPPATVATEVDEYALADVRPSLKASASAPEGTPDRPEYDEAEGVAPPWEED